MPLRHAAQLPTCVGLIVDGNRHELGRDLAGELLYPLTSRKDGYLRRVAVARSGQVPEFARQPTLPCRTADL
jgi:hypothetical protein